MGKRKADNEANFRNIVRSRDNWTCQKCGRSEYVQAHHIDQVKDYPLFTNLPDNGISLCVYCHADAHPEVPRNLFIANVIKAEKEGCISAGKLAKELKVNPRTIVRRARKLGILKPMQKWMFTQEEAEILRNEKYTPFHRKAGDMIMEQITVSFTIEQSQNEWIITQAKKRLLNKSIIIREAIELLKKKYGKETVDGLVLAHLARAGKLDEYESEDKPRHQ